MKIIQKDVLIIGSGLAGLYTSLNLNKDFKIGVVSKDKLKQSNSSLAQGGIAACTDELDSLDSHVKDTMTAGSYRNKQDAVMMLVVNAPNEIHKLIELGVEFDKDENGVILTTLEGGHSYKRILHANGDGTGKVIMETVVSQVVTRKNICVLENTMAIDIVKKNDGSILGVVMLQEEELLFVRTSYVIIASGGIGGLYKDTTNHTFSTGDGIALAKAVGCQLVDMCFIQFHPTALYEENSCQRFLITEAVRGEGARLLNNQQKSFMKEYDAREDLAPRDIVSKGVFDQMNKNHSKHIWLDSTHLEKKFLEVRFPTVYRRLLESGLRMEKDLIPVAPVAHYFIGGIAVDLEGRTTIPGIYACGEVSSTGVHGANRLASNSLLECVVFGKRTAMDINKQFQRNYLSIDVDQRDVNKRMKYYLDMTKSTNSDYDFSIEKKEIKEWMTNNVGIIRYDEKLFEAKQRIRHIKEYLELKKYLCTQYFEVKNMCDVALEVIEDAIHKDSIGCHYKEEIVYAKTC